MTGTGTVVHSLTTRFGADERKAQDIPGFDELWAAAGAGADFGTTGCERFRVSAGPVEEDVAACARAALAVRDVPPEEVDLLVLATTDAGLARLDAGVAVRVLQAAGLPSCLPVLMSLQQCSASISALGHAWDAVVRGRARHAVVVSFEATGRDEDRVRPFALFGDGVAGCVVGPAGAGGPDDLRLLAHAVRVDPAGLVGEDSFASRQQVARAALADVFAGTGAGFGGGAGDVAAVFATNVFRPLAMFGAAATGVPPQLLHQAGTLAAVAHCGNGDWMINAENYRDEQGFVPGARYLAQASAPGLFGCALFESAAPAVSP